MRAALIHLVTIIAAEVNKTKIALIYLIAVTAAELVTALFNPAAGVIIHVMILAAVVVHSAIEKRQPHQQLLASLALVPLVRIISLAMPLGRIPQIWWYPVMYGPLILATLVMVRILGYKARDIGFTVRSVPVQLAIGLSGFVLGLMEYLILRPQPMVARLDIQLVWLPSLIFIVCTGFGEEFIFRGVLQRSASVALGWRGIVFVGLLFAILHVGFLSWIDVVFVLVVALFFAWLVNRTGSLLGVTLAHGITNVMLFVILPLLF